MVTTGGFQCHGCGEKGGDVIDFHRRRYGLNFMAAAKDLGAWEQPVPAKVPPRAACRQRRPETPKEAARRLAGRILAAGYLPEALHVYSDARGNPLYQVIRARHPQTGEKWVRPMHHDGTHYMLGKPTFANGTPLYGLDLLATRKDETVVVCEGEKCADALRRIGVLAITSGSANSARSADWQPLAGREVLIWPDHDEPGQKYAYQVSEAIAGIASSFSIIDSSALNLAEGEDAVDWLKANPDASRLDVLRLPIRMLNGVRLYPIIALLGAEVEMISRWIRSRCIREPRVLGAVGPLYRDFCAWHGPDFAFSPSHFAAGLERLGVSLHADLAVGLALAKDFLQ